MQLLLVHSGLQGVRIWRRGLRWTPWFAFPFRSQGASARDHVDVMQDRAPPGDPGPRSLSRGTHSRIEKIVRFIPRPEGVDFDAFQIWDSRACANGHGCRGHHCLQTPELSSASEGGRIPETLALGLDHPLSQL